MENCVGQNLPISACIDELRVTIMKTEPLALHHQSIIAPAWKKLCVDYDLHFAEYSFANAYLFRKKHVFQLIECETPCVLGQFKNKNFYIIPSVPPKSIQLKLPECTQGKTYCFFPIPEVWSGEFKGMGMSLTTCRADTDYLFHVTKLQTMAGRELSSRRNLLNQLERNFKVESRWLEGKEIAKALDLLELWQKQSGESSEKTDYFSCKEALELMPQLQLFGRIIYADQQVIGFSIGELLTPRTALLHFAKSLHEVKGTTPYLYKDFALHLPSTVHWINMEQDLGIPALRQAKQAYDPDMLLHKWKAC